MTELPQGRYRNSDGCGGGGKHGGGECGGSGADCVTNGSSSGNDDGDGNSTTKCDVSV